MLACAAGNDLDVIGANYNTTRLTITPADDSTIPPTPAVMESDTDYRLRIQQAFEGLSVAGSVGAYQYHGRSADGRVADISVTSPSRPVSPSLCCHVKITVSHPKTCWLWYVTPLMTRTSGRWPTA